MKIWQCSIGFVDDARLPLNADWPMRQAANHAYEAVTGEPRRFIFSAWRGAGPGRYWTAKIGELPDHRVPAEGDEIMRLYLEAEFYALFGELPTYFTSDWDGELETSERGWVARST
jgi:hypothetical protein